MSNKRWLAVMCSAAFSACSSSHGEAQGDAPGGTSSDAPAVSGDGPGSGSGSGSGSGTCGSRTGMRGKTSRTIKAGGLTRTYIVYLPMSDDPTTPMPMVFVHHGYTMSGEDMYDLTGYPALADAQHIALAFPDGQSGPNSLGAPWNVGTNICPSVAGPPPDATGDDFAFLDAMKADIAQDQCLDTSHIFLTGFSMGGYFAHHVGCERPDIRAVAPHSGGTHALDQCPNVHRPIIIFHGLSDEVIPVGCDDPTQTVPSGAMASAAMWAAHNGCATTTTKTDVTMGTCVSYDNCPADGQVTLCTFTGMAHCWAGGTSGLYGCPAYASATQLEWTFFQQHAW